MFGSDTTKHIYSQKGKTDTKNYYRTAIDFIICTSESLFSEISVRERTRMLPVIHLSFLGSFILRNILFLESYKDVYITFAYNYYVQILLKYLFNEIVVKDVLNKIFRHSLSL